MATMVCTAVLDRRIDRNASTGLFELAYRQPPIPVPSYIGVNFVIEGQMIKKPSAGKATGDGSLRCSHDATASQNRVHSVDDAEAESGCISVHKLKPADVPGGNSRHRPTQNRTAALASNATSSVVECRSRHRAVANDAAREKVRGVVRVSEMAVDRRPSERKCRPIAAASRQPRSLLDSSDSDVEQPSAASRSTVTVTKTDRNPLAAERRRRLTVEPAAVPRSPSSSTSGVTRTDIVRLSASSTPLGVIKKDRNPLTSERRRRSTVEPVSVARPQSPMRRRKTTRPGAARPRRYGRPKPGNCRQQAASDADSESAASDHDVQRPDCTPSTSEATFRGAVGSRHVTSRQSHPPPQPSIHAGPSRASKRTPAAAAAATTCSLVFTLPSGEARRRRTPSLRDIKMALASTVKPSPAANHDTTSPVTVSTPCTQLHPGPPRPPLDAAKSRTLLPTVSSLGPVHHGGARKRFFLPVDSWIRYSRSTGVHVISPGRRSMVMRRNDLWDLQASMQIVGLGNTA